MVTSLSPSDTPTAPPRAGTSHDVGAGPVSTDRLAVLDVLRGIALLGMFLVHFNDHAQTGDAATGLAATYQSVVALFFEERFWTMFGILFGVGFAVQLRRAHVRGGAFAAR